MSGLANEAARLDATDPLADFRTRFALPLAADGSPALYLCGHSLGLMPLAAPALVQQELDDWARLGVRGHHEARRDWIGYAAAFLTTAACVPQAWLTFRTRDVRGISLGMYTVFTVGVALWLVYGLVRDAWPVVIANAVTLSLALAILLMKLTFREGDSAVHPKRQTPR